MNPSCPGISFVGSYLFNCSSNSSSLVVISYIFLFILKSLSIICTFLWILPLTQATYPPHLLLSTAHQWGQQRVPTSDFSTRSLLSFPLVSSLLANFTDSNIWVHTFLSQVKLEVTEDLAIWEVRGDDLCIVKYTHITFDPPKTQAQQSNVDRKPDQ